eukprot:10488092-Heterocapsa_arctica.AAC.1
MECLDLCGLGGLDTEDDTAIEAPVGCLDLCGFNHDTTIEAPVECLDLCGFNLGRRPARFNIESG